MGLQSLVIYLQLIHTSLEIPGTENFQSGIVKSHKSFRSPGQFVWPIYKNYMYNKPSKLPMDDGPIGNHN